MEYTPVDLYYVESGQGTPVVLLHAFPFDHSTWDPVAGLLQSHYHVIQPDLRGQGKSPLGAEECSIRLMAEDVAQLMDRLQIPRAILAGHSMGGYVALAFARAYPGRLAGLGLVATRAAADAPETRQKRLVQVRNIKRYGVKTLAKTMLPSLSDSPEIQARLKEILLQAPAGGTIAALKAMADRPDSTDFLHEITVPSVVITGENDRLISYERAETMAQLLGRGWMEKVAGAGHMLTLESPAAVAAAIEQLAQAVGSRKQEP
ncbi:MAG: alpha/beta hydrolase [Chloroflexi bacterium]|jgi:3-oxoadipate enol-lactonase|nr:alpha/beta hydrolase [Anaerolineaceae bacterium]NMB87708.1 alpha/beta hydrolase [Chloroflexota bacterium]